MRPEAGRERARRGEWEQSAPHRPLVRQAHSSERVERETLVRRAAHTRLPDRPRTLPHPSTIRPLLYYDDHSHNHRSMNASRTTSDRRISHARAADRASAAPARYWRQALVLGHQAFFGVSSPARRRTWRCTRRKPGCAVHAPSPVRRTCRLAPPPRLSAAVAAVAGGGAGA